MLIIDRFAYTNKFSNSSPYLKVMISLLLIFLSIVSSNIYFLSLMITGIILTTIFGAGIPKKSYARMIAAPAVYLLISIFTLIFTFGFSNKASSENFIYFKQFQILNFYFGLAQGAAKWIYIGIKGIKRYNEHVFSHTYDPLQPTDRGNEKSKAAGCVY